MKKIELLELKEKYLLNFTEHFSKLVRCYLIKDKTAESVLGKIKDYIKIIEKPALFQTDIGVNLEWILLNLFVLKWYKIDSWLFIPSQI